MSTVIGGLLVMAIFLSSATLMLGTMMSTWSGQADSLVESADLAGQRARANVSITNTSVSGGNTQISVQADNEGAGNVASFSKMDVVVRYTNASNNLEVRRLAYTSGSPGNNQWTLSSISPDGYNPGIWDPDETATLSLVIDPPMKAGTSGVVLLATPEGITDQAYFTP